MTGSLRFPLILAALLAGYAASQGLHKDQLIFFHGALRVAAGQIPYLDFSIPQGPLAPLLGGLVFLALPAGWAWCVLSAVLNVTAAWLTARIVSMVTKSEAAAGFAALVTAISFLPPFGSFYNDHLAYVFLLAAFALLLDGKLVLTGVLCACAIHTKQSVGGLGTTVLFIAAVFGGISLRSFVKLLVAAALSFLGGVVAVALMGGGARYWWDAVWLPFSYSQRSSDKSAWRLIEFVIFPFGVTPRDLVADFPRAWGRWVMVPYQLAFYAGAVLVWRRRNGPPREKIAAVFFWLSPLWCGALLGRATSHLFLGTGVLLGLLFDDAERRWAGPAVSRKWRTAVPVVFVLIGVLQTGQSFFSRGFVRYGSLAQSQPIALNRPEQSASLEAAKQLLTLGHSPFYALGERALLAAALAGKAPSQRSVYDDMAVSVPCTNTGLIRWQTEFHQEIERREIPWILRDDGWVVSPALGPVLTPYLLTQYRKVWSSGPLTLYRRRNALETPLAGRF